MPANVSIGYSPNGNPNLSYVVTRSMDIKERSVAKLLEATGAKTASDLSAIVMKTKPKKITQGRIDHGASFFLYDFDKEKLKEFLERHGQTYLSE